MATWQELLAYFKGSLTAGRLCVRIDRKMVEVGRMNNGVFAWTPAGMELARTVVIPRAIPATSPSPTRNRGGRPRKVQPEVMSDAEATDTKL